MRGIENMSIHGTAWNNMEILGSGNIYEMANLPFAKNLLFSFIPSN